MAAGGLANTTPRHRGEIDRSPSFGLDIDLPGMVRASVRMNPRKRGAPTGFDARAAEAMDGVIRVLEIPDAVAVIASNTWYAIQALDAIEYDCGPAPYPAEQADHSDVLEASFTAYALGRGWLRTYHS